MQVDVGYGDVVTPAPETADYPVILKDFPVPRLRVYSRYTVIAEKLEAMISLGIANTRMKDYFDLWVLCRNSELEGTVLQQAIGATLDRRATAVPQGVPFALTDAFTVDAQKQMEWQGFLKKNRLDAPALEQTVADLRVFLIPPLQALSGELEFRKLWVDARSWHD